MIILGRSTCYSQGMVETPTPVHNVILAQDARTLLRTVAGLKKEMSATRMAATPRTRLIRSCGCTRWSDADLW